MLNFIALLTTVLGALVWPQQVESANDSHLYANQTPYGNPQATPFKEAPDGYEVFFIEDVGRHGSRSLTSSTVERRALRVWDAASDDDALTSKGKSFAGDLKKFQKGEKSIGYGNLSKIGKQEWTGIGRRTATAYRDYLTQATANGDEIAYKVTVVPRTQASAKAMGKGLESVVPGIKLAPQHVDDRLLIRRDASASGNQAVERIQSSPEVEAAADTLLRRLYTPAYVDSIKDPVEAALDIYKIYCTAPGMAGDTKVSFKKYVPLEAAKVLAYAVDAGNFYGYGPGIEGEDNTYRAAKPVLDDFFTELDDRIAGGSTAAVFRPAHGETIMPFAALIGLPGSERQAAPGEDYTYDNNPWRGYVAGRLAGNVEWVAYRNAADDVLVTMRYNEEPVEFKEGCKASTPYFYEVAELKRCLS